MSDTLPPNVPPPPPDDEPVVPPPPEDEDDQDIPEPEDDFGPPPPPPEEEDRIGWSEPVPFDEGLATGPEGIALPPPPPGEEKGIDPQAIVSAAGATSVNRRLAPQDVDSERAVLGGILLTNSAFDECAEILQPDDFWSEKHRVIWKAIVDMVSRADPERAKTGDFGIDIITLGDELRVRGQLSGVGGPEFLGSLDAFVPATANVARYARIVNDKAKRRRMLENLHRSLADGYAQKETTDAFVDETQARILSFDAGLRKGSLRLIQPGVKRVFAQIEERYENKQEVTGLDTGLDVLNHITCGFQKGDLVIVAGRPSMGKTSVVMNIAAHTAIEKGLPVAVFSLEMSEDAIISRLFASEARVDGQRLKSGKLLDSDWPKLARAADRLHRAPLYIDDSAGLSANEMRARCRRIKSRHPDLALVAVDYLQLMKGQGQPGNREAEISDISRGLKGLAKELEVPVVALSQLNRSLERREDKRPGLSDLRESGAIEQDSDLIIFIYRDEVYNRNSSDKGIAELIIGKQRNGPTGAVRVSYLREYSRFENLAGESFDERGGA